MPKKRSKIFLLLASDLPGLSSARDFQSWLGRMPELGMLAEVEALAVHSGPSAAVGPAVWQQLAELIYQHRESSAGFIVLLGVDAILPASAAVSFLLNDFPWPIIFTGPFDADQGDGSYGLKSNLVNSVQAALLAPGEVSIMFGNQLLRANRAVLTTAPTHNIFNAGRADALGRIDFSLRLLERNFRPPAPAPVKPGRLVDRVATLRLYPTLTVEQIRHCAQDQEAVVVDAGGYRTLPASLPASSKQVSAPIIAWAPDLIEDDAGLIAVRSMTWESTVAKVCWALPQVKTPVQLRRLLQQDVAGEMSH